MLVEMTSKVLLKPFVAGGEAPFFFRDEHISATRRGERGNRSADGLGFALEWNGMNWG